MFVGHQVLVNVGFSTARARLANLVLGDLLESASQEAYGQGISRPARAGRPGSAPGPSELVDVQVRDLGISAESAALALRWQVAGLDGAAFPALDADIRLASSGDQATVLKLDGAFRPPPGIAGAGPGRAVVHQVAMATIEAFLGRIAEAIADPAVAALRKEATRAEPGGSRPPGPEMR